MVDTARHPSRRTIVKAGLWAAPAIAVVNLTSMNAAHASVCARTTYPSHGLLVYADASKPGVYYVFNFGDGTSNPPKAITSGDPNDVTYLNTVYGASATYIRSGSAGTPQQNAIWTTLAALIMIKVYVNGSSTGYQFISPTSFGGLTLVGTFVFDGSLGGKTGYAPVQVISGELLFTKCA